MICNKLNAKSVVLLLEYTHRDIYDTHHLRVYGDAQLITESAVDNAVLHIKPHIKRR